MGADEEIILLDFQDLGFGPIGIDLAGILIDHYYETNLELVSLYSNKFAHYQSLIYPETRFTNMLYGERCKEISE